MAQGKRRRIRARWIDDIGDGTFHIEGPGFLANITVGLHNNEGQEVTAVSITADGTRYGEEWLAVVEGQGLTPSGVGFRIVNSKPE